jgi:uncharacterized membrane protein YgcG
MKKVIKICGLAACMLLGLWSKAQVSVNINIGAQPVWGPVGYDYVNYYYLPEYDIYYDVPGHRYVYLDGGQWLFARTLPPRFATVNLYSTYKVVLNEPKAYLYHNDHKVKYIKYKSGGFNQVIIKNSKEPKYYVVKGHPNYAPQGQMKKSGEGHNPAPGGQEHRGNQGHQSGGKSSGGHGGGEHGGGHGGGKGKH